MANQTDIKRELTTDRLYMMLGQAQATSALYANITLSEITTARYRRAYLAWFGSDGCTLPRYLDETENPSRWTRAAIRGGAILDLVDQALELEKALAAKDLREAISIGYCISDCFTALEIYPRSPMGRRAAQWVDTESQGDVPF